MSPTPVTWAYRSVTRERSQARSGMVCRDGGGTAGRGPALVERPDAATAGVWPRAAALLTRQALELALAGVWAARPAAAGLDRSSMRSQLLCLTAYLDGDTATRAAYLYAALSHACHYHLYELALTATELTLSFPPRHGHPDHDPVAWTR